MAFDLGRALEDRAERLLLPDTVPVKAPKEETGGTPSFPVEVMAGAAGDFATVYGETLEPPTQFFYVSFLTCLGNVLAWRLTLASELHVEPRLYVLILGESADDRKSTAISKTVDFFKETITDFPVCYGLGSAEGLEKVFAQSANTLVFFDELRTFVSKSRIDG